MAKREPNGLPMVSLSEIIELVDAIELNDTEAVVHVARQLAKRLGSGEYAPQIPSDVLEFLLETLGDMFEANSRS